MRRGADCWSYVMLVPVIAVCILIAPASLVLAGDSEAATPNAESDGDFAYEIIRTDAVPGIRRSLDVLLSERVSEEVLEEIALELKEQDYEQTFIVYYLPGMVVDSGGWATTHFTPSLEVSINGLTVQEAEALIGAPLPADEGIVGIWLDERPFAGSKLVIYEADGSYLMERLFTDGSSSSKELVQSEDPSGQRFDPVEESPFGDHWIINEAAHLELRDDEGLITIALKMPDAEEGGSES